MNAKLMLIKDQDLEISGGALANPFALIADGIANKDPVEVQNGEQFLASEVKACEFATIAQQLNAYLQSLVPKKVA